MDADLLDAPAICPACGEEIDGTADIDHVAIDRALRGDQAVARRLSKTEKYEAIRTGLRRGMTLNVAAARIGMNGDERRKALGQTTPRRAVVAPKQPRSQAERALAGELSLLIRDRVSGVKGWTRGAMPGHPGYVRVGGYAVELSAVEVLDEKAVA